jgi:hypothetical protein
MKGFTGEHTKEFFAKLYYNRCATFSPSQVSGMLRAVIGFCRCNKGTDHEIIKLEAIAENPIKHVLDIYGSEFTEKKKKRLDFKKTLSQLDWLYYRDASLRTPLNKEYFFDLDTPHFDKKLRFEDIIEIRERVAESIDKTFTLIAQKNDFAFNFDVSAYGGNRAIVGGLDNGLGSIGNTNQ